ncbi:MAG: hypothetical protein AAB736_01000 [Patescibacteria group bacterium]
MTDEAYRRWVYDRAQITMEKGRAKADALEDGYCSERSLENFSREELIDLRDSLAKRPHSGTSMKKIEQRIRNAEVSD